MKKFGKILSSVLAASMLVSAFAMNAFAASKAHTVTVSADKTEGLVAGDTVTIELTMDNTEALVSCEYVLSYDDTAFVADTTKVSRLEKYIDKTWLDGMKDTDGDWGYYLGNPVYSVADGAINFAWAGSEGVEADYAMDNRVIGKFYLTVADGAADGTYTFALTGKTMDAGENAQADFVTAPITVTVGSGAVEPPAPTTTDAKFYAVLPACEKAEASTKANFTFNNGEKDAVYPYDIGSFTWDTAMTVGVQVTGIPEGTTVTLKSVAFGN